jgi:hypothetical protein
MKVFIVFADKYESRRPVGVFDSLERAVEFEREMRSRFIQGHMTGITQEPFPVNQICEGESDIEEFSINHGEMPLAYVTRENWKIGGKQQ